MIKKKSKHLRTAYIQFIKRFLQLVYNPITVYNGCQLAEPNKHSGAYFRCRRQREAIYTN